RVLQVLTSCFLFHSSSESPLLLPLSSLWTLLALGSTFSRDLRPPELAAASSRLRDFSACHPKSHSPPSCNAIVFVDKSHFWACRVPSSTISQSPHTVGMMSDYSKMKNADLEALLKERGLPHSGKKADLVARLQEDDKKKASAAVPEEDEIDWDLD